MLTAFVDIISETPPFRSKRLAVGRFGISPSSSSNASISMREAARAVFRTQETTSQIPRDVELSLADSFDMLRDLFQETTGKKVKDRIPAELMEYRAQMVQFLRKDCQDILDYGNGFVFTEPLWPDLLKRPTPFNEPLQRFMNIGENSLWKFWRDWYQGFLDGKPLDWELQRRVALIHNDIWDAGPEAVAAEIERIRGDLQTGGGAVAPEDVKSETVTSLFAHAPVVQASMAAMSEAVSLRVNAFATMARPNEQIAFVETMKTLPQTAESISQLVAQGPANGGDVALALEVGRLRAEVEQLKADLKAAHDELESLRKKPWYKKSSVLVSGAAISAVITAIWTLSGDDKSLEDRWNKLAVDLEFLSDKIWPEAEDRIIEDLRFELPDVTDL